MIIKYFFTWEFIRFAVIGVINTFSSAFISMGYLMFLNKYAAAVLGYLTATVISYFLNCAFTFKQRPSWRTFIRFPVSCVPNFIMYILCYSIAVGLFSADEKLSLFVSSAAAFPLTFLTMKLFTFKSKNPQRKSL